MLKGVSMTAMSPPCRFADQCNEEGSCANGCEDRAPVAYLRPISHPDWLEVCQKGEPGAFPVYSKEVANG